VKTDDPQPTDVAGDYLGHPVTHQHVYDARMALKRAEPMLRNFVGLLRSHDDGEFVVYYLEPILALVQEALHATQGYSKPN
jgi:hypothetical protein